MISLFGAGFIGGEFAERYKDVEIIPREQRSPTSPDIINFISSVDNYNVNTDIYKDVNTNIIITLEILDAARKRFGSDVVFSFISTWFVYGITKLPAKEDESPCNPTGFYSITKRAAEELVRSYCETFGLRYRILRLGNVIGIGDKKISAKKNALQYMIRELAHNKEINLYKNGAIRDYIDVRDCVSAIRLIVDKGEYNCIYNVSNGQGLNVRDLVDIGHRTCGFIGKIKEVEVPEFHKIVQTPKMWMDVTKLKKLGYVQEYDIKQTVRNLAEYYQTHAE